MVQNFLLFADGLATAKIRCESLNVRTTCGLNTEKARKLKPRKFLLEVIYTGESAKVCTSENFPLYGIYLSVHNSQNINFVCRV